jgi:hypothetical protein
MGSRAFRVGPRLDASPDVQHGVADGRSFSPFG